MDAIAASVGFGNISVSLIISSPFLTHKKSVALANPMATNSSSTRSRLIFFFLPILSFRIPPLPGPLSVIP